MTVVTCIGGGPGTDIFAIIAAAKWIFPYEPSPIRFHIFDRAANAWNQTLDQLLANIPHPSFDYAYHQLNIPDGDTPMALTKALEEKIRNCAEL